MTPEQISQKLTKGDQIRFQVWNGKDQILYFEKPLNDKQGFFRDEQQGGLYRKDYKNILSINGRKLNENMSLKKLLQEEIDNVIQSQKQEALTFESDPIEYIIQRYPSLDATMIDLMTDTYRDYITGIYVMAPKPTTFKILLHNGQSFYLTYNPKGYIAKVSGKQYMLMGLKEEEYAIKAISKLLMMGIPPSAPGPEGEQSGEIDSKDSFAADMTSEPDLTAGLDDLGGTPEETPTEEPEEELQEQEEPQPKKYKFRIKR
jgi:hypothetical protein